jgi:methyltransferase
LAFITLQRLGELWLAQRNTARLLAAGGREFGRSHYPWMVALHASWIAGLWWFGYGRAVDPALLAVFVLLQAARVWVIASLGPRWTTRIIVLPGERLVAKGPYRWLRHPNYLVVALEIAVVPLALGLPVFAALFSVLNAAILYQRIRQENAALA